MGEEFRLNAPVKGLGNLATAGVDIKIGEIVCYADAKGFLPTDLVPMLPSHKGPPVGVAPCDIRKGECFRPVSKLFFPPTLKNDPMIYLS